MATVGSLELKENNVFSSKRLKIKEKRQELQQINFKNKSIQAKSIKMVMNKFSKEKIQC